MCVINFNLKYKAIFRKKLEGDHKLKNSLKLTQKTTLSLDFC